MSFRHWPFSNYFCLPPEIAALGTIINVSIGEAVLGRDSNLLPTRQREGALRVEPQSQV